jgi:hypothetical protein
MMMNVRGIIPIAELETQPDHMRLDDQTSEYDSKQFGLCQH